jgi:hypothetical protein
MQYMAVCCSNIVNNFEDEARSELLKMMEDWPRPELLLLQLPPLPLHYFIAAVGEDRERVRRLP